ncbi:hypothetical protein GCM10022236_44360 [Microlunatus ginsengisoli]|uniref:Uncharacterized protein n=1 Tax=Microlunatus ginsengisoli TaxID=363863 RepID=A0ABP7ANJ6_9ACTN
MELGSLGPFTRNKPSALMGTVVGNPKLFGGLLSKHLAGPPPRLRRLFFAQEDYKDFWRRPLAPAPQQPNMTAGRIHVGNLLRGRSSLGPDLFELLVEFVTDLTQLRIEGGKHGQYRGD